MVPSPGGAARTAGESATVSPGTGPAIRWWIRFPGADSPDPVATLPRDGEGTGTAAS